MCINWLRKNTKYKVIGSTATVHTHESDFKRIRQVLFPMTFTQSIYADITQILTTAQFSRGSVRVQIIQTVFMWQIASD